MLCGLRGLKRQGHRLRCACVLWSRCRLSQHEEEETHAAAAADCPQAAAHDVAAVPPPSHAEQCAEPLRPTTDTEADGTHDAEYWKQKALDAEQKALALQALLERTHVRLAQLRLALLQWSFLRVWPVGGRTSARTGQSVPRRLLARALPLVRSAGERSQCDSTPCQGYSSTPFGGTGLLRRRVVTVRQYHPVPT